jgi:hypothetical protein
MWTVGIITLIVAAMIFVTVRRGLQMRSLAASGVAVKGKVVKKWRNTKSTDTSSQRLRYQFEIGDGQTYAHAIVISIEEDQKYQIGDEVDIIYLPSNPKISALASMVALAQEALNKKSTS